MTAISRSRGRRAVRTTLAVGTVSLGLAALAGCGTKPTPNAHFTLGTDSSSPQAASDCYGHGEALDTEDAQACLHDFSDVETFRASQGDTFRIGVDPSIAEEGWLLFVNGQPRAVEPFTVTYRSFPVQEFFQTGQSPALEEELADDETGISIVQVGEGFDTDAVLEAAQAQDLEAFNRALSTGVEGVWNVRLAEQ
ncbi:DUF2771 domain-containing protein [Streptomyces sp. ACA25]|uniref:DUF2771 domain-containing protein n=1 Tax=Streptomyces sp. ACA25 TaxID=3022596 RepID=UPI0023071A0C|nr:DUF2771 domain-containing protein [Streptomyces sp. ACA25]MDB1088133.1 DUF2771 domain-containing protein [Streptomyces sp. ACA25]